MGKTKQRREPNRQRTIRPRRTGLLEVHGRLDILSVGHGDMKVTITPGDEAERERAKRTIEKMMRLGFAIFVEEDDGTTHRVRAFDPEKAVYLIDETDAPESDTAFRPKPSTTPKPKRRSRPLREVPIDGARAVGVANTAGG